NRLKDEFLATVSHELRTPLNALLGWVQILTTTTPNGELAAKAVGRVTRNTEALSRVVDDLVDVSRMVTGKLNLRFEQMDFRSAVLAATEVLAPQAAGKGVLMVVNVPDVRCPVRGDRDRLQQVVWNLLSNAIKFTSAGGTVTVELVADAGDYALRV